MKKILNKICVGLAFICLGIGSIGIILPILPTTPFLLMALILFAKGSGRFHRWFLSTKLYKNNLEDFVVTKSMTLGVKIRVLLLMTVLFAAGILFSPVPVKIVIGIVAAFHYLYFIFGIKTAKPDARLKAKEEGAGA